VGVGSVEDEGPAPVGVGRGEQHAHRAAVGDAEHGGALAAGGVHDGAHVVHALLERRDAPEPVGEPGAALVEQDEPAEAREPGQEMRQRRIVPGEVDVRDEPRHEDEIERPLAQHLIGDANLAAPGVARVGGHG
jgi:hypothetical protein